jgi:hypothetical protein
LLKKRLIQTTLLNLDPDRKPTFEHKTETNSQSRWAGPNQVHTDITNGPNQALVIVLVAFNQAIL